MSTAVTEPTRQDLIEREVTILALEILLANLLDIARRAGVDVPKEAVGTDLLLVGKDGVPSEELWDLLWPEEEDRERPEYLLAQARADVLAAQIAASLAVSSEGLMEISDRLSGIAREELAKAAGGLAQGGSDDA